MLAGSAPLVALLGLLLIFASPAAAHEVPFRGLVLGSAGTGEIVVRHGPEPGIAAGTSTFRLGSAADAKMLSLGTSFTATADIDTAPPTLSDVHASGTQTLTGDQQAAVPDVMRVVQQVAVGQYVPSPPMLDQQGRPFRFHDLREGPVVLAFVYTRCRDARECPLIAAKFRVLQGLLAKSPAHLVLATIDPEFDTPAVLATYAKQFGADPRRWSIVTGDPETMLDFDAQFGVTAFPDQRIGLIHPERTVLLDRFGGIRQLIDTSSWTPNEIADALADEERLGSNPIERLDLWLSSAAVAICGNAVAGFSGFTDLLTVIAIAVFFTFLLWRVGRAIARGAT